MWRSTARLLAATATLLAATACGQQSLMPKSGGRPYEVVVVDDYSGTVRKALQLPVEGLPQEEPQFDVSAISSDQYNLTAQTSRSIVVTAIDEKKERISIRYERDALAKPQLIIYLTAHSEKQLMDNAPQWGRQIRTLLNNHETAIATAHLHDNHNAEAEKRIKEMFGVSMLVPADMTASKRGDNFLWIATNGIEGMRSICLYTIPRGHDFADMRDSVMKRNLPGETDNMYMQTRREGLKNEKTATAEGQPTVWRGLWEMENDAMGGPFVAHVVGLPEKESLLVAEAFVYAPETTKRNKLKLTEAALHTLKAR